MLDDLDTLLARDTRAFLARLAALPDAYDGPDAVRPAPYGFDASGAMAVLTPVVAEWVGGRLTTSGTQFLVAGGFDAEGDLPARRAAAEAAGAETVVIGLADTPSSPALEPDVALPGGALTPYHLVRYLAHATGRATAGERLAASLRQVAQRADPRLPTAENPAKSLAWSLWQRVPLLVGERAAGAGQALVQQAFARVGKALAVTTGRHGVLVAATAFEGRHALADDLVALVVGRRGTEADLLTEVLGSRVAQVEHLALGEDWLPEASGDLVLDALTTWYGACWAAAYGGLLAGLDPSDETVYGRVRAVA